MHRFLPARWPNGFRLPAVHRSRTFASVAVFAAQALLAAVGLLVATTSAGGASTRTAGAPTKPGGAALFDAQRAYALTRMQLSYGPRPAGSSAQRRVAGRLRSLLPAASYEPLAGGLRNIVGGLPGRGRAIVVAAHYDTTPVPGYLGANNSAAGVGAVIELARDLRRDRAPRGAPPIRFALFDGEEAPAGFTDFIAQGLRGSRAYAAAHAGQTREVIVLDFIALPDERLPREQGSDAQLWQRMRAAARRSGATRLFPAGTRAEVLDDHTPFVAQGIPAIDLIDFDYRCWQKLCDDLSQVSVRNLGAVGKSVLALVRSERRRLAAG
jgi:hypothetical protein